MGFRFLFREPDGATIYGVWHLILGACSQQEKRNGWLTSDGERTGSAWGVTHLAVKFGLPEKIIQRALDVLCSEEVGWITNHEVTVQSPSSHLEEKRREEKEENRNELNPPPFKPEESINLPTMACALQWLSDARKNGADYTEKEVRAAYLAMQEKGWQRGGKVVTDYRAALERQIGFDRQNLQAKGNGAEPPDKKPKFTYI